MCESESLLRAWRGEHDGFSQFAAFRSGRPDPLRQWTVLAGVEYGDELICLATGTKSLSVRQRKWGDTVDDCHAEALVMRAFRNLLWRDLAALVGGRASRFFVKDYAGQVSVVTGDVRLITTAQPCGLMAERDEELESKDPSWFGPKTGAEPVDEVEPRGFWKPSRSGCAREQLGLSLSCSDKVDKWRQEGCVPSTMVSVLNLLNQVEGYCGPVLKLKDVDVIRVDLVPEEFDWRRKEVRERVGLSMIAWADWVGVGPIVLNGKKGLVVGRRHNTLATRSGFLPLIADVLKYTPNFKEISYGVLKGSSPRCRLSKRSQIIKLVANNDRYKCLEDLLTAVGDRNEWIIQK